jgi:hypothetical protein
VNTTTPSRVRQTVVMVDVLLNQSPKSKDWEGYFWYLDNIFVVWRYCSAGHERGMKARYRLDGWNYAVCRYYLVGG